MQNSTEGGRRQSILYVDDEQMMLDVLKDYVETMYDLQVKTASSTSEARKVMEQEAFDAIISDYQMPGQNGIEFLKELRESGNTTPFILFTGKGREEIAIEALNNGADFYIQKGGEPNSLFRELIHYVTICSDRKRREDELQSTKETLESFVQNTADALIIFDIQGKILSANSAFEEMYGWSRGEAIGQMLPMVPAEQMDEVARMFREVADKGSRFHYIRKRLRKNGELFDCSMTVSPVKDADGRTIAIAGLARDITNEVRARETIERQREEFNVLLRSIGDAVIATDREGKVTFMNHVASMLTGYDQEEALGKRVDSVFHIINEDTREPAEIPVKTVMEKGIVVGMANHTVVVSRNGVERMIEDSAAPIKGPDGEIKGVVMVFRDATVEKLALRRREARRRVSELLATAERLDSALPAILESIAASLKFQVAEIWFPQKESGRLQLQGRWHRESRHLEEFEEESEAFTFGKGEGLPGSVFGSVKPRWVEFIGADSLFRRNEIARKAGLKSVFGVPLSNRGQPIGSMLFFGSSDMPPDENMMNTMEDIGKQVGLFIGRLDAERSLRVLVQNMQSFMKHSPLIIIRTDLQGRIIAVNDSFEKAYGWREEEVVGRTIDVLIPPGERRDLDTKLKAVAEGEPLSYEAKRAAKDGRVMDLRVMLSPIKDEGGKVVQITSVCREITEEKKALAGIRLNNAVIENLNEMVLITEPDAKGEPVVVYANPAYLAASGQGMEKMLGKLLWDLDKSSIDTAAVNQMYNSYRAGLPYRGELIHFGRDGEKQYVDTNFFPLRNENGRVTHWVQLQRDVTSSVEQREELRRANEKLNLMETISRHDMLNHLQAIEIYTHMVLSGSEDSRVAARLDRIKKIAEQMKRQLGALKEIQTSGSPRWMNVQDTFLKSVADMDMKGIRIEAEGENVEIMADPLLDRVFYNLVDNSMRHGQDVSRLKLRAEKEGEHLKITYTDDGIGINDEQKRSIFSGVGGGQNHGLRLVREILGITGIAIRETGEEGKGVKFEMFVPGSSFRSARPEKA